MTEVRARVTTWLREQSLASGVAIGFGVLVVGLFTVSSDDQPVPGDKSRPFDLGAAAILAAAIVLVVVFRRRFPGAVVLTVIALT